MPPRGFRLTDLWLFGIQESISDEERGLQRLFQFRNSVQSLH